MKEMKCLNTVVSSILVSMKEYIDADFSPAMDDEGKNFGLNTNFVVFSSSFSLIQDSSGR